MKIQNFDDYRQYVYLMGPILSFLKEIRSTIKLTLRLLISSQKIQASFLNILWDDAKLVYFNHKIPSQMPYVNIIIMR